MAQATQRCTYLVFCVTVLEYCLILLKPIGQICLGVEYPGSVLILPREQIVKVFSTSGNFILAT